jgi:biopolymer transport protein ExbB
MAGGISEALITTQSGLLVAIPGLFMSAFLNRRAHRLESRLNEVVMVLKRYI